MKKSAHYGSASYGARVTSIKEFNFGSRERKLADFAFFLASLIFCLSFSFLWSLNLGSHFSSNWNSATSSGPRGLKRSWKIETSFGGLNIPRMTFPIQSSIPIWFSSRSILSMLIYSYEIQLQAGKKFRAKFQFHPSRIWKAIRDLVCWILDMHCFISLFMISERSSRPD